MENKDKHPDSGPKAIGYQYSPEALVFLQDVQAATIDIFAACINPTGDYEKQIIPFINSQNIKEITVCPDYGINMFRSGSLPAYAVNAVVYSNTSGTYIKVGQCELNDNLQGLLTVQNCHTESNMINAQVDGQVDGQVDAQELEKVKDIKDAIKSLQDVVPVAHEVTEQVTEEVAQK